MNPAVEAWNEGAPVPPKKGASTLVVLAVTAVLIVVAIAAGIALMAHAPAMQASPGESTLGAPLASAPGCTPAPCLAVDGVTAAVTKVERHHPPAGYSLDPGHQMVLIEVAFDNGGSGHYQASDLEWRAFGPDKLQAGRILFSSDRIPGCSGPAAPDMLPGGHWGPLPLCFDVNGEGPVTLEWQPHNPFGANHDLILP